MNYVIQTINLTKKFSRSVFSRRKFTALDRVNLLIPPGDLFVLLGPNGAGKTTLVKILTTLILPCDGTAYVGGYNVVQNSKKVRQKFGLVADGERSFYWRLTGRQNLMFFATLNNPDARIEQKITRLAELLDITADLDRMVKDYSAGMRQKLSFIRGLLHDPQIIIMDEPFKNLDPITKEHLVRFIKEDLVGKLKKTVFLTTHNLYEAQDLGTTIAIMHHGKITKIGSLDELKAVTRSVNTIQITYTKQTDFNTHDFKKNTLSIPRENLYDFIDKIRVDGGEIVKIERSESTLLEIYRKFTGTDAENSC
ncbi:ABC transporter ATP-binding protein [candidate division KSB1 bacterium]|nr:ABC transporter ATP-binding protein [candidate division KSB1 bacterium]